MTAPADADARGPATTAVPAKPSHRLRTAAILAAFAGFTFLTSLPSIGGVELDIGSFIENWRNGADLGREFLQPDFGFLDRTWGPMLETLQMAVVGAGIAAVLSIPITLWAARPTSPSPFVRQPTRFVINVMRAVPDLVYATILVAVIGVGPLPGLITLVLFDVGIIVKLVSEAIDSGEHPYMEAGLAAGGTQTQVNRGMALAQSWPLFTNQWLYVLELNVRISAILGVVGAGGIGRLLSERRAFFAYDDVGAIVLQILVVVVVIELISSALRKRLT